MQSQQLDRVPCIVTLRCRAPTLHLVGCIHMEACEHRCGSARLQQSHMHTCNKRTPRRRQRMLKFLPKLIMIKRIQAVTVGLPTRQQCGILERRPHTRQAGMECDTAEFASELGDCAQGRPSHSEAGTWYLGSSGSKT